MIANDSGITCPDCGGEMEQTDTTFSNVKTDRCNIGDHTGNILSCEPCECLWIENLLNGNIERFEY